MAAGDTFPKISRKIWWLLRDRFKKSMPTTVNPTFVSAVSSMTDDSARANVISPLRQLRLVDENDKPTSLAERWRHDDEYAKVCQEIRQNIYPQELIEAYPDAGDGQRAAIKNWFMKTRKVGENAARQYTDTYVLLSEADPSKVNEKASSDSSPKTGLRTVKPKSAKSAPVGAQSEVQVVVPQSASSSETVPHSTRKMPAIHIDVQVHISPDTPADQIDRIFESMAKHLGGYIK